MSALSKLLIFEKYCSQVLYIQLLAIVILDITTLDWSRGPRHLPGVAVHSVKVTQSIHPTEETLGSRFMIPCLLAVSLSASTDKHLFFVSVWAKWRLIVWHAGRPPLT